MEITQADLEKMVTEAAAKGATEAVRSLNPVKEEDRPGGPKPVEKPNVIVHRPRPLNMARAVNALRYGSWKKASAELEKDFTEATRAMFPFTAAPNEKDEGGNSFSWPANVDAYRAVLSEGSFKDTDSEFQKMAVRAMTEGTPTTTVAGAGALTPIQYLQDEFVLALTSAVVIQNIPGVETIPITSPVVALPRESTAATSTIVAEAGTLTASDPTFTQQTFTTKKIYGYKQYSNELLADANPALNAYLGRTLARDVALQKDYQFLVGSGSGANLTGLASYSGLTTPTGSGIPVTNGFPATYDSIVQMIWALRRVNAEPTAFVMHPALGQFLATIKDAAGRPLFLDGNMYSLGGANMPISTVGASTWTYPAAARGTILNVPVFFSTQLSYTATLGTATANTTSAFIGNFNFCKILERAAVDIAISEHILFTTDQTAMRAIWRGSLALTQPTAFAVVPGFVVQ
jgi:HK97 family phage major capsid protein